MNAPKVVCCGCGVEIGIFSPLCLSCSAALLAPPEHIASESCWCEPTADYVDPDTGVTVYVHKALQ